MSVTTTPARLTAPRSDAGTQLRVVPIDKAHWPASPDRYVPNHYIQVTLDLDVGELRMHADEIYRGPDDEQLRTRGTRGRTHSWDWQLRYWRHQWHFPAPMPRQMIWYLNSPNHLDADQAKRLMELIAVQARILLAEQVTVPERESAGADWSLAAAAAVKTIDDFTRSHISALAPDSSYGAPYMIEQAGKHVTLLDLSDAFASAPELIDPEWAVATDTELDAAAAKLADHLPWDWTQDERVRRAAHIPEDVPHCNSSVYAVGVLAALYRYRREAAGTLIVRGAAAWFAQHPGRLAGLVVDDTSDTDLKHLAAAEERAAAHHGHRLLGTLGHLHTIRTAQRQHIRGRLRRAGAGRAALLLRVDSWNDPVDGGDTTRSDSLAKLAGIPQPEVQALRERARLIDNLGTAASC